MRVFITGATGFIGSAVVEELIYAGHEVTGLARSDASAAALAGAGVHVVRGSLEDLDCLRSAAKASEGVIHTAHNHDFENVRRDVAAAEDFAAIKTMGEALTGTGLPLITTSATAAPTEADDGDPGYVRYPAEQATLALAAQGVRSMVVRLPPTVHGDEDRTGFIPRLIALALEKGRSVWIGAGQNRWPSVHRRDAAHLFRLALENGKAGSRYHAVHEEGIPTRDIAEAIGKRLNQPAGSIPAQEAPDHFGFLAHILEMDIHATSIATQKALGWSPKHPGLIEDIKTYGC